MTIYDEHPAQRYIDIFVEDYLRAVEGEYFYWLNSQVIARIASPEPTSALAFRQPSAPGGAGEAVGAWGSYPPEMTKGLL